MKISLIAIGKTEDKYLIEGIDKYLNRLKHYINFSFTVIPDIKNTKNLTEAQQKSKEAELILKQLNNSDLVVLMDEKGKNTVPYCSPNTSTSKWWVVYKTWCLLLVVLMALMKVFTKEPTVAYPSQT